MKTETKLRLRRLQDPRDHVRLQEFFRRELPGYLFGTDIYLDITKAESVRLSSRNAWYPRDRIDLGHPRIVMDETDY